MPRDPITQGVINFGLNYLMQKLGLDQPTDPNKDEYPELADIPAIHNLKRKDGSVTFIVGCRDLGKTVTMHRLAEIFERPIYVVSPQQKPPPPIIRLKFEQLSELPPPRSTLGLDDIATVMSVRDYGNKDVQVLEKIIPVVRHERKLHIISAAQVAGQVDKWLLDAEMVILKAPNPMFGDIERPMVKKLHDRAMPFWSGKSEWWLKRHCYVITRGFEGLCRVALPSFYKS